MPTHQGNRQFIMPSASQKIYLKVSLHVTGFLRITFGSQTFRIYIVSAVSGGYCSEIVRNKQVISQSKVYLCFIHVIDILDSNIKNAILSNLKIDFKTKKTSVNVCIFFISEKYISTAEKKVLRVFSHTRIYTLNDD